MSSTTSIEWTSTYNADGTVTPGSTWNPVRGCTKISPGCAHCYAETFAERFRGVPGHPYEQGFDLRLVPEKLAEPLSWKKPRKVFVNSMSDLFHEDVPDEYIDKVVAVAAVTPYHTYQCLTKRAERMEAYWNAPDLGNRIYQQISRWLDEGDSGFLGRHWDRVHDLAGAGTNDGPGQYPWVQWRLPLRNWWSGVSVENRKHGLPRIEHLLRTPAAVRFLSVEPLLEYLGDIRPLLARYRSRVSGLIYKNPDAAGDYEVLPGIRWVIVGGESGHGARPMKPAWVRSIRDQCQDAGVAFFFKQWGAWAPKPFGDWKKENYFWFHDGPGENDGVGMWRVGKKNAGRLLDGREWNEMPNQKETVQA